MYRLQSRGMGAVDLFGQRCTPIAGDSSCPAPGWWMSLFGLVDTSVGVAPAPPVDVWTVPPASGVDAQATVDTLLNQQLVNQQTANAAGVQSSVVDQAASGVVAAGSSISSALSSPWLWGLLGLGAFALVAVGGDQPRRYGR
jgi:hypothetical protein